MWNKSPVKKLRGNAFELVIHVQAVPVSFPQLSDEVSFFLDVTLNTPLMNGKHASRINRENGT